MPCIILLCLTMHAANAFGVFSDSAWHMFLISDNAHTFLHIPPQNIRLMQCMFQRPVVFNHLIWNNLFIKLTNFHMQGLVSAYPYYLTISQGEGGKYKFNEKADETTELGRLIMKSYESSWVHNHWYNSMPCCTCSSLCSSTMRFRHNRFEYAPCKAASCTRIWN